MTKEYKGSTAIIQYVSRLHETTKAFREFASKRRWFVGPSVADIAEFSRIVAQARADLKIQVYQEYPFLRTKNISVTDAGLVLVEEGPEVEP